jgi:hypothetical protein
MSECFFQGSAAMLTFWRVVMWIGCGGLVFAAGLIGLLMEKDAKVSLVGAVCWMFCFWAPFMGMVVLGLIAQWAIRSAAKAREQGKKRRGAE